MEHKDPKLRTVNKSVPPFELNKFPKDFPYHIGEQMVYILATRGAADIEGKEWELIFANAIGAVWQPSVVGLDDIVLGNTAWGAKSILSPKPSKAFNIRLISGRNDLINSYEYNVQPGLLPNEHGHLVLNIYNERISAIKEHYKHTRTAILIRKKDLTEFVVYETPAIRYDPDLYYWKWGVKKSKNNLFGYTKKGDHQKFTWQSGGQQFTIFEEVPKDKVTINIKRPAKVPKEFVLDKVGFSKEWITVT